MSFGAALCNQVRGYAAHRFESDGSAYDEVAILGDSLNVEPSHALDTVLMPLGVGLHALHHLAPAIPFHNLQRPPSFAAADAVGLAVSPRHGSRLAPVLAQPAGGVSSR